MNIENIWALLAGLAIFLYGMMQLEESLKALAGRTFKLFLKKNTSNKYNAVLSGTLTSAILQSSSVVSFMVLGFVGAGLLSMPNALAVIFGSNLGTTLANWLVVMIGFNLNIENFAFPFIAIAGLGFIIFSNRKKIYQVSKFLMGFGLLFLGLSFMKESFESLVTDFDIAAYTHLHPVSFVFIGFFITALIQSSSATMVITLSALHSGAIPFETAVALVIGSELGTTVKIVIGSLNGVPAKKRVALGNVIFNIVITIAAYIGMYPMIHLIVNLMGISDPLIALVMFQTLINLFGILMFLPFLNKFTSFLEQRFKEKNHSSTAYIKLTGADDPEAAIEAMEKETSLFIHRVIWLNMHAFQIEESHEKKNNNIFIPEKHHYHSYEEKYDNVKLGEGEILAFYTRLSESKIEKHNFIRFNQLIAAVRNAMYAAKGIKDIHHDRREFRESSNDLKFEQYHFIRKQLSVFYQKLIKLMDSPDKASIFNQLKNLMESNRDDYELRMKNIYKHSAEKTIPEKDISTLLNVNRELYSSSKALLYAMKDYMLDQQQAEAFNDLPVVV